MLKKKEVERLPVDAGTLAAAAALCAEAFAAGGDGTFSWLYRTAEQRKVLLR